MTEFRPTASQEAVSPMLNPAPRGPILAWGPFLAKGLGGLLLGAVLTIVSVRWANAPLGLLSLLTVLGSLTWISLGLVRHYSARFHRS
jgi:hypothetical protein